ncbi:unnamed protein product [Gordionus sp. m RMFG-2023]|uniref:WD repeat-containing protein 35-like n=1 Tax=Gordionus sp. m RMFG-2023 TaxID=3053472 RepID=UPI0030E4FBDD
MSILTFYNSTGNLICKHACDIRSKHLALPQNHIIGNDVYTADNYVNVNRLLIVASKTSFCVLFLKEFPKNYNDLRYSPVTYQRIFHIDDIPSSTHDAITDLPQAFKTTNDSICCLYCSNDYLTIGRTSGDINLYSLPKVTFLSKISNPYATDRSIKFITPLQSISLNRDSSIIALLDCSGNLKFGMMSSFEETAKIKDTPKLNGSQNFNEWFRNVKIENVWAFKWAQNDPQAFCYNSKSKILQNTDGSSSDKSNSWAKGPILYYDMQIVILNLNSLYEGLANKLTDLPCKEILIIINSRLVSKLKSILKSGDINKAIEYVNRKPHKILWKMIYDNSLDQFDLQTAELSAQKLEDYASLYLIKKAQMANHRNLVHLKNALIFILIKDFESAETELINSNLKLELLKFYRSIGNLNKLLETSRKFIQEYRQRERISTSIIMIDPNPIQRKEKENDDRNNILDLMNTNEHLHDDDEAILKKIYQFKTQALMSIGDHYLSKNNWKKAIPFYKEGKSYFKLIECYLNSDDHFTNMVQLLNSLDPDSDKDVLQKLASIFRAQGMYEQLIQCLAKMGECQSAIDICIETKRFDLLNQPNLKEIMDIQNMEKLALMDHESANCSLDLLPFSDRMKFYSAQGEFLLAAQNLSQKLTHLPFTKDDPLSCITLKKIYVLMALLYMNHCKVLRKNKKKLEIYEEKLTPQGSEAKNKGSLGNILDAEMRSHEFVQLLKESLFKADVYHFLVLAQKQFYQKNYGDAINSLLFLLQNYELELNLTQLYTTLIFASIRCSFYNICLWGLSKLKEYQTNSHLSHADPNQGTMIQICDSMKNRVSYTKSLSKTNKSVIQCPIELKCVLCSKVLSSDTLRVIYRDFKDHNQIDISKVWKDYISTDNTDMNDDNFINCDSCEIDIKLDFKKIISVVSGKPLADLTTTSHSTILRQKEDINNIWTCRLCKRKAYTSEIQAIKNCPLCHFPISNKSD